MIRNSLIFLAALILNSFASFAQVADSSATIKTDTLSIISAKKIDELSKIALNCPIDTGMISFHLYNPVYKESFSPQFLGNSGSAFQNNIFTLRNINSPFIIANPFLLYFHNPYKRLHFNTKRPFAEISYITAGNRQTSEQVISALHTQNFNQYTNIGLEYNTIASRGLYLRQEMKVNRFSLFGSYDRDNYSIYTNVSSNKSKSQENGGLVDIPTFKIHPADDPIAYSMFLDNASSGIINLNFFATQSYRFKKTVTDTSSVKKEKDLPFMVNHTLRYDRYSRVYNDEISAADTFNFYDNNFYNRATAADSASQDIIENSFQISGDEYKFLPGFILGAKHQYSSYNFRYPHLSSFSQGESVVDTILPFDFSTQYNNLSLYAMLLFVEKSNITYQGKLEYFFAGYRLNDLLADFSLKYKVNKYGTTISAFGKFYATEPDFYLKQYNSSHFQWNTTFPKTTTTSAYLSLNSGNGTIYVEGGVSLLGNFIYMNNMAIPAQADKNLLVSSLRLEKKFSWGGFKHIHKFALQKVNHEAFLQIPLLAYGNTSYYENAFFKSVLKFQIGFDFYVNSSYYADAYMPATGLFYRQDIAKVGEYPFLDGFINWKVKRTRFFVKYTNALAGVAGYNYFTTYGYPMNPGSLKFGLSWTFYD
jgi:hypothetical protein